MKNSFCIWVFISLSTFSGYSQSLGLKFEELEIEQQNNSRPTVVFIHAEWCKYCEKMQNTTFQNPKVRKLLENNFYFVSFDGEHKTDVTFLGRTFRFKPSGNKTGIHELAEQLATKDGRVNYPSLVFLNEKYEILYVQNEFVSSKQLLKLLEDWNY